MPQYIQKRQSMNLQNHTSSSTPSSTVIIPQLRHETHSLPSISIVRLHLHALALQHTTRTTRLDMRPQTRQDLAVLPSLRHRPVRRLEAARRLRPLARVRAVLPEDLVKRLLASRSVGDAVRSSRVRGRGALGFGRSEIGACAFGVRDGGRRGLLRCPVVDVPVVLVEERVELLQLGGRHGAEVGVGEGGQEQVAF